MGGSRHYPSENPNLDSDFDPLNTVPIDPCSHFAGLDLSPNDDTGAIMPFGVGDFAQGIGNSG